MALNTGPSIDDIPAPDVYDLDLDLDTANNSYFVSSEPTRLTRFTLHLIDSTAVTITESDCWRQRTATERQRCAQFRLALAVCVGESMCARCVSTCVMCIFRD
jgi:hypothetical protein